MKKDTKKKGKHPGGAPTRYNKTYLPIIANLAAGKGYTNEQLAKLLGVSERTVYNWQDKYPEFLQAIKSGKEGPIDRLENALYRSAEGYDTWEEEEYYEVDDNGKRHLASVKRKKRHIPSNATSNIFALCNMTKKWKRKQEITVEEKKIVIRRIKEGEEGDE